MKRRLKKALSVVLAVSVCTSMLVVPSTAVSHAVPAETTSASQIVTSQVGESVGTIADNHATIRKYATPTQWENVFDITLEVETDQEIGSTTNTTAPDTAVSLVVDVSRTMAFKLATNSTSCKEDNVNSRINAAKRVMLNFLDDYAKTGYDKEGNKVAKRWVSLVGFGGQAWNYLTGYNSWVDVATDEGMAVMENALRYISSSEVGKKTVGAVLGSGNKYLDWSNTVPGDSHDWTSGHSNGGTNIEAGLRLANNIWTAGKASGGKVNNVNKEHSWTILLSDGEPTMYVPTKDETTSVNWIYGDTDDSGESITKRDYTDVPREASGIVGKSTFEIVAMGGDGWLTSTKSYDLVNNKTCGKWLKEDVLNVGVTAASAMKNILTPGDGEENLSDAFDTVFETIGAKTAYMSSDAWQVKDSMNNPNVLADGIEFLGFYDQNDNFVTGKESLDGTGVSGSENTADLISANSISWDLHNSGYTKADNLYKYELTYRVRLNNEAEGFVDGKTYDTNFGAALTYQYKTSTGFSENKELSFPVPAVKGYLDEFSFVKVDAETGAPLEGVAFNLYHDPDECHVCKNNTGYQMTAEKEIVKTATSDANGHVVFAGIPSGHSYTLEEVKYNNYELAAPIQVAVTYNNTYAGANYNMETELYESAPQAIPTGLGGKYETSTTGTFKQVANVHEVGTVKLTKLTDGTGARGWHRFPFTVKAIDAEGNIDMSVAGKKFGHVFFDAQTGIGSITMKAGETKTFSGLPAGITLLIEEVDIGKGYTTSHVVNPAESEYKKDGEEPKGEIVKVSVGAGAAVDVTFTNYRYDPARDELGLYASKTLVGGTLEADDFTFILEELGRFKWESKNNELGGVKFPIIIYTARQPGDFDNNYYSYDSVTNEYYKNEDVANSYYKLDDVTNDYYTFDPVAATHYYYSYEPVVDTISTHTYYIYEKVAGSSSTIFDASAYKVQVDVKVGRNGDCKVDTESAVYTKFPTLEDAKAGTNGTVIQANQISFTNRKVYDLTVAKTISGNGANSQDEFPFRITLNDATINETFGGVVFTNGVGEFTLKGGQSKTFRDLPGGVGYTVTEVDSKGYTVTAADGEGAALTVTEGSVVGVLSDDETVTFDNYKKKDEEPPLKTNYYDLTVRKELSGNNTSTADVFSFQITLNDETINAKHGDVTFVGGKATFTLKGGESITAKGLPEGIVYTVTETDSGAGYEVEYSDNAKDATLSGDTIVTVTNSKSKDDKPELTKSATISVKKVWVLDDGAAKPESVTVTLYRTDEEDKTIPLETAVLNQSNDWSKTWTKTWTGEAEYTWSVDETDVPEGFTKTVTHEGNAYTITNNDKSSTTPGGSDPDSDPDPDPEVIINDGDTPRDEMTLPDPELPREEMILPDPEVPKTGDVNLIMWLALAVLSGFGLLALLRKREEN